MSIWFFVNKVLFYFSIVIYRIIISVWPTQPFGPRPPLGGKTICQKEQPFILNLTLHILSQTTNIEEFSSLSFILEKLSSLIFVSLGSKGKGFRFEKGKFFLAEGKKSAHTPMTLAFLGLVVLTL